MRILVSNDDGYLSPGIAALANALGVLGEVVVVAPDRDRSGASNSLTLSRPLRVKQASNGYLFVDGTPTDCVHLALFGLLDDEPDLVVSGINAGANLGDDVIYSGTVAAAMEGRFLGLPAIAVSLVGHHPSHYETAARVAVDLVARMAKEALPSETVLNVNVPDLPYEALKGLRLSRLGQRHKAEPVHRELDPRGQPIYWIGAAGPEQDGGEDTDFHAIRNALVSVTPLHTDLTRDAVMDETADWLTRIDGP